MSCSVNACSRPVKVKSRQLCGMHDARRRKHGDVQAHRPCRDDRRPGELWCSTCEQHKPKDEFHRNRATKSGRDGVCKVCVTARYRRRRVQIAAQQKAWRLANPERVREKKRRSRLRNLDAARARDRGRRRTAVAIRAQNAARYARIKGAPGHSTPEQVAARWAYYGGRCWMCGAVATDTDHVKPLAAGGSNWPANQRPACSPCNRSKSGTWPYARAAQAA